MNKPIRTALVGYGSVAEKMHAPLIAVCSDLDLVAVVERNGNRCEQKFPSVKTFRSVGELLEADAADLICITTPNEFHFSMAKQCLLAGKHVVVDKPVTIYSWEAEELERISREKGLVCSVFQNRRYDGDFLTLQKLVAEKTLGELVYLESHFDRFRPNVSENWREKDVPGNGITYDLGAHLIDQPDKEGDIHVSVRSSPSLPPSGQAGRGRSPARSSPDRLAPAGAAGSGVRGPLQCSRH